MQLPVCLSDELTQKWPHVITVIEVARERQVGNATQCTSHFYLLSLDV